MAYSNKTNTNEECQEEANMENRGNGAGNNFDRRRIIESASLDIDSTN